MTRALPALVSLATLALAEPAAAQHTAFGEDLVARGTGYSPGVMADGVLYVSGLQGADPRSHKLPMDFNEEVRTCLDNVGRVLKDAGMDYSDVVSVQIYLVNMDQFPAVDAIYKTYFNGVLPARTTVGVSKLSLGSHIEISAVARK